MRNVARPGGSLPGDLSEKQTDELAVARAYFGLSVEDRANATKAEFKAYKLASVKVALERLFGGKCAYCESVYDSTAPVDIEHYRPKGRVQEAPDHDGYWWLAADWDNLLPSCIDCNRRRRQPTPRSGVDLAEMQSNPRSTATVTSTGKKDAFPLADERTRARGERDDIAQERPLLLNPCVDRPEEVLDFTFHPDIGASIVYARGGAVPAEAMNPVGGDVAGDQIRAHAEASELDLVAAMSIHTYGLNRVGLVQARTRVVRQLQFLAGLVVDLDEMVAQVEGSAASEEVKKLVISKTSGMQDRILQEMRSMTEPTEPYSATAKAWVDKFLAMAERP